MRAKAIIPLALGLGVGLFAVKFLVDFVKRAQGSNVEVQMVQIVRATQDISSFVEIRPEFVELVETTENSFISSQERIGSLEDVVGRVTGKAIPQHSPILNSMLAPEGTASGTKGKILPGYRAVSVKIDEVSGVAYQISPDDWVDVIVVMDVTTGARGGRKDTIAEVILQHVKVLAIGRGDAGQASGGTTRAAKSATLLVAEQDVPKLHLAGTRGKITLSMRGDDDVASTDSAPTFASEVFAALRRDKPAELPVKPVAVQAPKPKKKHSVTIYKRANGKQGGTQVETTVFDDIESRKVVKRKNSSARSGETRRGDRYDNARGEENNAPGENFQEVE